MDGQAPRAAPRQHLCVEFGERVPGIHQQNQSEKRFASDQIAFQRPAPLESHRFRHLCEPIAWEIDQFQLICQLKHVDHLRPSRGLRRPGKVPLLSDRIERTGFSRIRAPSERHFRALIGGEPREGRGARQIACTPVVQMRDHVHSQREMMRSASPQAWFDAMLVGRVKLIGQFEVGIKRGALERTDVLSACE